MAKSEKPEKSDKRDSSPSVLSECRVRRFFAALERFLECGVKWVSVVVLPMLLELIIPMIAL